MASLLAILIELAEERRIPRRYIRDRSPAFYLPNERFKRLFRLDKESVIYLCNKIKTYMPSSRINMEVRVLAALRFFATGSYQSSISTDEYVALSQQTVSRCIQDVSVAISVHILQEFIRFPTNDEITTCKKQFSDVCGFPGTIGAIDCTHVAIVKPQDEPSGQSVAYINRKGYYSINVQLIVGSDLKIYGISARYPGSVHDSFIWKHSIARQHISQLNGGWLVGDSGYPLEPWLMTPFLNASPGSVEECFNQKHSSTRVCVERCNGVLKARFRCLLKHRVLHYSPTAASHIINSCAALHNLCIVRNIEMEDSPGDEEDDDDDDLAAFDPTVFHSSSARAENIRYRIALSISEE